MFDLEELHDKAIASLTPKQGSVWLHKKGNKYTVLMLTNMDGDRDNDTDFPPTVVYKGEDGRVWSRPLTRWHGSFTEIPICTHCGYHKVESGMFRCACDDVKPEPPQCIEEREDLYNGVPYHELSSTDKEKVNHGILTPD